MELNISIPTFVANFVVDEFWQYAFYGFLCGYVIPFCIFWPWSKWDNRQRLKRYQAGEAERRQKEEETRRKWEEHRWN